MTITNEDNILIDKAYEAFLNAHAPYSKFKVGAALLMKDGNIINGANVENCTFGLTNCAERTAIFYAFSQGYRKNDIVKIAVLADTEKAVSPCGACRQIMSEHLTLDCPIILTNITKSDIVETNIRELLPYIYELPSDL
ncbi:cytidine deaminase [Francisella frigiditurris]|uniref:Cytidine deaminase n=1 Tax=Francisella frigiditurris TaxID=1542390 RepID=A0A1J0KT59_9GAMM|nr:cytidine deaminase [Francisella frigiditurris]APC96838.1 cytidine deaminase [Francisella frigiditurris]